MADKADVIEMFSIFRALELANGPVLSPLEKLDAVASVWADVLDDIPAVDLKAAAKEHARNSAFWPKPAEIRKLCPSVNRKQLEAETKKESGINWFAKVKSNAGNYGPNTPNASARIPGTWTGTQVDGKGWERGRANLIAMLADGNPAYKEAIAAGVDAVGWKSFHEEGWKYRENKMRDVFDRAFSAALEKYTLDHPEYNVIQFEERKRIAAEGRW